MQEAGLDHDAIQKRRQEESYKIIQEFENWMNSVSGCFTPKFRMGKALVYTYTLLPRLSRYVLDGRYNIDNNGVENTIRPLANIRKKELPLLRQPRCSGQSSHRILTLQQLQGARRRCPLMAGGHT